MRHVSDIKTANALSAPTFQSAPAAPLDEGSARVVNALFRELKGIFPAWRNAWPSAADEAVARKSWVKKFMAEGLSSLEQIRYGVERCRDSASPFMPSVGEFVRWCRPTPEALGCPAVGRAYSLACAAAHPAADRSGLHAVVNHAAVETGFSFLLNAMESRSRPVFERNYELAVAMLARGETLRAIPKALPEAVVVPASRDVARANLNEIRKKLRGCA